MSFDPHESGHIAPNLSIADVLIHNLRSAQFGVIGYMEGEVSVEARRMSILGAINRLKQALALLALAQRKGAAITSTSYSELLELEDE